MSSRRREQFLPGADGSIRIGGRSVDARDLASELAVFPDLQAAVAANDVARTLTLLDSIIDPQEKKEILNQADKDGFRLLHRACALGSVELMEALLEGGADPNARDNCGDAPMHWACFSGNIEAVTALLKGGADPLLASSDGKTPLDAALEEKHTHILQLLFGKPWDVYDTRAILEAVLLRGPVRIKVQSRFVASRKVWRLQHTVLSSMLRALFIYVGKDMTDDPNDCEHIWFQNLLAVRWQHHTHKRYVGRRFNVYARIEENRTFKFNFTNTGIDSLRAEDFAEEKEGEEVVGEGDDSDGGSSHLEGSKKGFASRMISSFRKSRANNDAASEHSTSKSFKRPSGHRTVCIAFLAESAKEARRWMDAFKTAGEQGKTMPCVRIQTAWRGYSARLKLKRLKQMQESGSEVVSRRGVTASKHYTPIDASNMTSVPPVVTALTVINTKRPSLVNQLLNVAPKRRMTNIAGPSAAAKGEPQGIQLPRTIKNRKTTAVALPVDQVIDTAEDKAGYLKKRSETGVSGALGIWKNRFIIISHTAAEVQWFNPKRRPPKVNRVPFAKMLSVKEVAKDKEHLSFALRLTTGMTYRFQATSTAERDEWMLALKRVLPRGNAAAVQIQRFVRGMLAKQRVEKLKQIALQRAMRKRDEALLRIEEARQRAAVDIAVRASKEEAALLIKLQEEEAEHRRRMRAAKKRALEEAVLTESPLPKGWQQFTDKRTGRIYYYNKATKETTWSRPTPSPEDVEDDRSAEKNRVIAAETTTDDDDDSEEEEEYVAGPVSEASYDTSRDKNPVQNASAKPADLPAHWREVVDANSGETYYFNTVTRESTWTRPSNEPRKSPWSKRLDAVSGHNYYYNETTGVSQWEVPDDYVESDEQQTGASAAQKSSPSVDQNKITPSKSSTKKRSSAQKESEAIQSPLTKAGKRASLQERLAAATETGSQSGNEASSPTTQTLKTLQKALEKTTQKRTRPDHWQRFIDLKSGAPYYVNTSTGEKTWTRPAVLGGPKNKKESWIALKDDKGREYFNNSITGESVWELPPGERLASEVESPDTDATIVAAFTRHIDHLLSNFPRRRQGSKTDDAEENPDEQDWSVLDEEDNPFHYVALHEKGGLLEAVRSGLVLCRLVNRVVPETIDPRAMNIDVDALADSASTDEEREHVARLATENVNLFLGAVRALGGQLSEKCTAEAIIGRFPNSVEDTDEAERHRIVLEAVWEVLSIDLLEPVNITRCKPLLNLINPGGETVLELDCVHESEKILRWLNFHVSSIGPIEFGGGRSPEFIAAALACALWAGGDSRLPAKRLPAAVERLLNDSSTPLSEVERAALFDEVARACQSVGIRLYASRAECLRSEDVRLQLACCASVFFEHHNLPEEVSLTEEERNELQALSLESDTDESRDERILRTWINSLNIPMRPGSNAPSASVSPRAAKGNSKNSVTVLRIKNLFYDLRDGVVLLHVLNTIKPSLKVFNNYPKIHVHPENKFHMLENASTILELAKLEFDMSTVNVGPFDIVDGNRKLVLGLSWQIMRYASVALLESIDTSNFLRWKSAPDEPVSEADVLNWANDKVRLASLQRQSSGRQNSVKFVERPLVQTEVTMSKDDDANLSDDPTRLLPKRSSLRSSLKRSSVELVQEVTSFKDATLKDGYFLLSLINAVRPGSVNWKHAVSASFIDCNTPQGLEACEKNAKYVISVAFKLGCSVFLSWEDIVEVKSKALFVFVAGLIVLDAKQPTSRSASPASPQRKFPSPRN